MRISTQSKMGWLGVGLLIGLVVGGYWPVSKAHAVATDRFESYAMCTSAVDESLEALYILDALTGELKATAISQQTGQFANVNIRNIAQDLQLAAGDQFKFLLVSGGARLVGKGGAGFGRGTMSLIYVAEVNSGKVIVYTTLWGGQRPTAGNQPLQLTPIGIIPFRDQALVRPGAVPVPEKK